MVTDMTMSERHFQVIARIVEGASGIQVPPDKESLVVARVQHLVRRGGYASFNEWFAAEMSPPRQASISALVDSMTTNHTFFWREPLHFEYYRDEVLPELVDRGRRSGRRDLRVWCGAASRGQEPYTLQMLAREALGQEYASWSAGLLATDLCTEALAISAAGIYPSEDVERLPEALRQKYMTRRPDGTWAVSPVLKQDLVFRRMNLMRKSLPFRAPLDVVFLRNVLIYFDQDTKERLLAEIHRHMRPGGVIFVGTSESLQVISTPFTPIRTGIYRRSA